MLPVRAATRFSLRRAAAAAPRARPQSTQSTQADDDKPPQYYSPWNKWFPYEPVPRSPRLAPYKVEVQRGVDYWWCSCGESKNQPWCDSVLEKGDVGSMARCGRSSSFLPTNFEPVYTGKVEMCGCKHGCGVPKGTCDYTCHLMWIDNNIFQALGYAFVGSFAFGTVTSWWFHP